MTGQRLTRLKALRLNFGMSLNSRIPEIEATGIKVDRRFIKTRTGKSVKEYWFSQKTIRGLSDGK